MSLIANIGSQVDIDLFKSKYTQTFIMSGRMDPYYEFHSFDRNWTLLHEAAKLSNTDIAWFLISDVKQDPNMVSDCHWTPLQLA